MKYVHQLRSQFCLQIFNHFLRLFTFCKNKKLIYKSQLKLSSGIPGKNLLRFFHFRYAVPDHSQRLQIPLSVTLTIYQQYSSITDKGIGYDSYIQINTFILFFRPCGCWYDGHLLVYFFQQIMRFFRNK